MRGELASELFAEGRINQPGPAPVRCGACMTANPLGPMQDEKRPARRTRSRARRYREGALLIGHLDHGPGGVDDPLEDIQLWSFGGQLVGCAGRFRRWARPNLLSGHGAIAARLPLVPPGTVARGACACH